MPPRGKQQVPKDEALEGLRWIAGSALFRPLILRLDDELAPDLSNLPELAEFLPLPVWAAVLAEPGRYLIRAQEFLPRMPDEETQISTTGVSGGPLLIEAIRYCELLDSIAGADGLKGSVLEFGAGWGRLGRLLLRSVPVNDLTSLDPLRRSLEIAESSQWGSRIVRCKVRLDAAQVPKELSLAFASQLFMRISPEAFIHNLRVLADALVPGGRLMIGVRIPEFWLLPDRSAPDLVAKTMDEGIWHEPGKFADLGETAVSMEWMKERLMSVGLERVAVHWEPGQPHIVHWSGIRTAEQLP